MKPRLQEKFETEIQPAITENVAGGNINALPRIEKIVLNMGVGSAVEEKKHIETAVSALAEITGQKPLITLSRKSVANLNCVKECLSGQKSRFVANGCTSSLTDLFQSLYRVFATFAESIARHSTEMAITASD